MMDVSAARQDIERRNAEFSAAFMRGDMEALAALYTDDATVLPPGGQVVEGRQGIRQFWDSVRASVQAATLTTRRVESAGDLAYEIGTATLTIAPPGGAMMTDTVKYVVVWKRQGGGTWRIHVDIWNSNT